MGESTQIIDDLRKKLENLENRIKDKSIEPSEKSLYISTFEDGLKDFHPTIIKTDIIPGKIEPMVGSIRTIRIDNFLSEKHRYNGQNWVPICRFPGCSIEYVDKTIQLCNAHKIKQMNIIGEKMQKADRYYKWTGKEWKLLCSVEMCQNYALKTGKCSIHNNGHITFASNVNAVKMYKDMIEELKIKEMKKNV